MCSLHFTPYVTASGVGISPAIPIHTNPPTVPNPQRTTGHSVKRPCPWAVEHPHQPHSRAVTEGGRTGLAQERTGSSQLGYCWRHVFSDMRTSNRSNVPVSVTVLEGGQGVKALPGQVGRQQAGGAVFYQWLLRAGSSRGFFRSIALQTLEGVVPPTLEMGKRAHGGCSSGGRWKSQKLNLSLIPASFLFRS